MTRKYLLLILILLFSFFGIIDSVYALVDIEPSGIKVVNGSGGSTYTRKVATAIGIYSKNGIVPGVHKYRGTYAGINYNVLEVDVTDTNGTFLQVDYAGYNGYDYLPKNLNDFYDTELTNDDEYFWVGAINAGFFTAATTANDYGYPTGAVKKNGNWLSYSPRDNSYTWDTTAAYGTGFVTAYFNKNDEFKLIYNGWKNGNFYKYYNDPSPNTWDYGEHVNYSEGVSGAYTLIVDGDNTVHWGKNDYVGTNFWNYAGTAVTLFGQKENGNYVLVTTEGTLVAENQVNLMTELGCVNAIRFDGGGSTQMTYDEGLILNHFYISKKNTEIVQGSSLDVSDIGFDLYMEDETYYYATSNDIPQAEYQVFTKDGEFVEDISSSPVGDYWLKVLMNGLEQQIAIKVIEPTEKQYTVTFDYDDGKTENVEKVVKEGSKVEQPTIPSREGYTFVEWQYEGKQFDFNTEITQDITLTAKWKIKEFQITFDTLGGSNVPNQIKEYMTKVDKPQDPVKEGYTFIEWQYEGKQFDFNTEITQDITLTAKWKIKEFQITFDTLGGSNVPNQVKEYMTKVDKPQDPVKEGYTFVEWQYEGKTFDFNTKVTKDITLTAKYKIVIPNIEETSGYELDGNYLKLPANIISNKLSLGLSNIYNIKVYNAKNEEKKDQLLATSDKIQILLDDIIVSEYVVVIKGDITGDGKINVADVGKLYQYLKKKITMEESFVKAGNIIEDNEIRITDVGKLYQFIKGKIDNLEG